MNSVDIDRIITLCKEIEEFKERKENVLNEINNSSPVEKECNMRNSKKMTWAVVSYEKGVPKIIDSPSLTYSGLFDKIRKYDWEISCRKDEISSLSSDSRNEYIYD